MYNHYKCQIPAITCTPTFGWLVWYTPPPPRGKFPASTRPKKSSTLKNTQTFCCDEGRLEVVVIKYMVTLTFILNMWKGSLFGWSNDADNDFDGSSQPANLHHIINPIWYQEDYVSTYLYLVSRILLHLLASTKSFQSSELLFPGMSVHKCYNLAKNLNSLLLAKVKYVCRRVCCGWLSWCYTSLSIRIHRHPHLL